MATLLAKVKKGVGEQVHTRRVAEIAKVLMQAKTSTLLVSLSDKMVRFLEHLFLFVTGTVDLEEAAKSTEYVDSSYNRWKNEEEAETKRNLIRLEQKLKQLENIQTDRPRVRKTHLTEINIDQVQ